MSEAIYYTPDLNLPYGSHPDPDPEDLVDSVMDSIEWSWYSESGLDPNWVSNWGVGPSWGSESGLGPNRVSDVPMVEQSGVYPNRVGVPMIEQSDDFDWEGIGRGLADLFSDVLADEGNIGYDDEMMIAEYESVFDEDENDRIVLPSASKVFIENLDSVVITQQDVDNDDVTCAVCTDDMSVGEIGKLLPCSHRYHGDCIVSWLVMRNTCPVCRCGLAHGWWPCLHKAKTRLSWKVQYAMEVQLFVGSWNTNEIGDDLYRTSSRMKAKWKEFLRTAQGS